MDIFILAGCHTAEVTGSQSAFGSLVLVLVKKVDVLWKRGEIMSGQLCNSRAEPRAEGLKQTLVGGDHARYP